MDTPLTVLLIVLAVIAVALFGVTVFLLVKLWRLVSVVRSGSMPLRGKAVFWAALSYGISPVDLLPAPVYLDDVAVLAGAIAYVGNLARRYVERERRAPDSGLAGELVERLAEGRRRGNAQQPQGITRDA